MNDITNGQNRDDRLNLLRAQRVYYRRAKRLQTLFLVLALLLPWIGFLWGAAHPQVRPTLVLLSVVLLLTEIGLATRSQRQWVKTAARIQEQFDTEVFKLPWNQLVAGAKVDPEAIRMVTSKPMSKKERASLVNWYEDCVSGFPLSLARLVCQRTNITYDMRVRKMYASGALLLTCLLAAGLMYWGIHKGILFSELLLTVIVPFTPLAAFALREYRQQSDTVENLTTLKSEVEKLWTKALGAPTALELAHDSRNLQDAIFRNRASHPLVYDWVYWLMRKANEDLARHAAQTLADQAQRSLDQDKVLK